MKKILLFAGMKYYPAGGADDFVDSFESISEAKDHILKNAGSYEWANIIDTETGDKMEIY